MQPDKRGYVFCQRCRAGNRLGQEYCVRCGTRLMLMVEPSTLRFEDDFAGATDYEDDLLERISALEGRLARAAEKLEVALARLSELERERRSDGALLETLVETLSDRGVVNKRRLSSRLRERRELNDARERRKERLGLLLARILGSPAGRGRSAFADVVRHGFALLENGKGRAAIRHLERAVAHEPGNAPLNLLLGEHFFAAGRSALARDYLARAVEADPREARASLLLGLMLADAGDTERAKELLTRALLDGRHSYAARHTLGRLAAHEGDWKSALAEFRRALVAWECPEAHYVVGYANYQLGRFRTALRSLGRAVELDDEYGEAHLLAGLAQLHLGEVALAREAFKCARASEAGRKILVGEGGRMKRAESITAPPFFGPARHGARRLLTGGDARLAAALREDVLRGSVGGALTPAPRPL